MTDEEMRDRFRYVEPKKGDVYCGRNELLRAVKSFEKEIRNQEKRLL